MYELLTNFHSRPNTPMGCTEMYLITHPETSQLPYVHIFSTYSPGLRIIPISINFPHMSDEYKVSNLQSILIMTRVPTSEDNIY